MMSLFYIYAGVIHFSNSDFYLKIMPPYLPYHLELVYISGALEILLGIMLIFNKTRYLACWGLIVLLIAVFPANIYFAQTNGRPLDISPIVAWGRLPFQAVFIGIAYWHSKKNI